MDQLFDRAEKRLARALLLLARYGEPDVPQRVIPPISQEKLPGIIGTTRSRVNFSMNPALRRMLRRLRDMPARPVSWPDSFTPDPGLASWRSRSVRHRAWPRGPSWPERPRPRKRTNSVGHHGVAATPGAGYPVLNTRGMCDS